MSGILYPEDRPKDEPTPILMFGKNLTFEIPHDLSQGMCGNQQPEGSLTCRIPVVKGEAIHILAGGHISVQPDGTHVFWPIEKCTCSCHSCCIPLHESCGDCEEDHVW